MRKEQFLTLLNKIEDTVDQTALTEWPGNITCEMTTSMKSISKIELNTKRCNIFIWLSYASTHLCVKFKVGSNYIENSYKLPMYSLKWTSPVWRKWCRLAKVIAKKHNKAEKMKHEKKTEEQIEVFNNLFYNSFPEDIDDIFFNKDDK